MYICGFKGFGERAEECGPFVLRRALFIITLLAGYAYLVVYAQVPILKNSVYHYLLDKYGRLVSSRAEIKVHYNPGLRAGVLPAEILPDRNSLHIMGWEDLLREPANPVVNELRIAVVTPEARAGNRELVTGTLRHQAQVLVQCSRMDAWHTSAQGQSSLESLRGHCLRVVVFDGGHHLPTVGMCPDIIIVPETGGYAAHSYMVDGMEIERLKRLLIETGSPSVLVSIPRWALVKSNSSLGTVAGRTVRQLIASGRWRKGTGPPTVVGLHTSKLNGVVFCYTGSQSWPQVRERIVALGLGGIRKVCLAFDYRIISPQQAALYSRALQESIGKPVETVNQPVNVSGALWRALLAEI